MAGFNDTGMKSFAAGEALEEHRRVKLSSGSVVYADAGEEALGVTSVATANGELVMVSLTTKPGTVRIEAGASITAGDAVYGAADGKITTSQTGKQVGTALDTVSSGEICEVILARFDADANVAGKFSLFSDFTHFVTADEFTATATDSGTSTVSDAVGGILTIQPSDGTVADNDEIYIHSTAELFKFAANKRLFFESRLAVTEANTNNANVLVGVMDAVAANALVDDAGGTKASYSGAVFYKLDGETEWKAEVSIGATQTAVTLSTSTFPGDGTYQRLGIEFDPGTGATDGSVNFYLDGALVGTASSFNYTSATEMDAVVGLKNGSANNESAGIDYILCEQVR